MSSGSRMTDPNYTFKGKKSNWAPIESNLVSCLLWICQWLLMSVLYKYVFFSISQINFSDWLKYLRLCLAWVKSFSCKLDRDIFCCIQRLNVNRSGQFQFPMKIECQSALMMFSLKLNHSFWFVPAIQRVT